MAIHIRRPLQTALLLALGWLATTVPATAATPELLPTPDGPAAVGFRQIELEVAAGRRSPAILFYPAAGPRGATRPYLPKADAEVQVPSLARNFRYEPASVSGMLTARAHSTVDAPPLQQSRKAPILIFSPGYMLYPGQNTELLERLASHGYIVVAISHPGDAIDLRLADGSIARTSMESDKDTRFAAAFKMHTLGKDHAERTAVLHGYAEAFAASRLGRSMAAWRDDTLAVANAIEAGTAPAAARDVLAEGDYQRLGLIGMSFGGATAATTCKLLPTCRVAVNLDGENFDPELFNRSIERPMLLIMSDWARYPLFPGQSPDPAFHPVDYAYEPWARAGLDPDIQRVRLDDIGHMGFTDLIGLMSGPKRDERVGSIPGAQAFRAIGDISLAFLNRYLAGGDPAAIDRAIAANPKLHRHDPAEVRNWSLQNR